MSDKKTYWLVDGSGDYALVTGADERDRWRPHGWTETGAPTGAAFVWARAEGIEQPGRFPADILASVWSQKGWEPGAPPEPVSPYNADQPGAAEPAPTAAEKADTTSKTKTTAVAAGDKN